MNSATKTILLSIAMCCLIVFNSCTKYEKVGHVPKPGIAITFDDSYINEWYKCIPLFDSFDVKVTFYISSFNRLSQEQKLKLHKLQEHGHEIAYHSVNHYDLVKYLQKNKMKKLEEEEISAGLCSMKDEGFYPTTFAYPYGSHNEILDNCLLRKFTSVRALNGSKDYSKSFTATSDNSVLYGMGIDVSSGKSTSELINFITLAKQNNNCLILVGHHIDRADIDMEVPYDRLRRIITSAKSLGMEFYTVSEISRK